MFESNLRYRAAVSATLPLMETLEGPVSYRNFHDATLRVERVLRQAGLVPGMTVLVSDSRPFVHWAILFALDAIGCVSVSEDRLGNASSIVAYDRVFAEHSSQAHGNAPITQTTPDWVAQTLASAPWGAKPRRYLPTDSVRILLTSGTTGTSKQVLLTRAMIDAHIAISCCDTLRAQSRMLIAMGLDTLGGYMVSLAVWSTGGSMLYGANPNETLRTLHPSFILMAPIQLQYLLAGLSAGTLRRDEMRIAVGGGALPKRLLEETQARLTNDVVIGYGSTEASYTAGGPAASILSQPGALGHVLPGSELEIVDEGGEAVQTGEIGRVRVRSIAVASGYVGGGDTQEGAFDADGWFYPGDLGWLREDGLFVLEGRDTDVLNLGGVKVSTWSIEEMLLEIPGVSEVAAFSLPDISGIETLHAAVVVRDGATMTSIAEQIARRARNHFLRLVEVNTLPRNGMGKILRAELRESIGKELIVTSS